MTPTPTVADVLEKAADLISAPGAWIEWSGGICPVELGDWIMVRLRSGWESDGPALAGYHRWDHGRTPESPLRANDIIAYRVVTT